MQTIFLSQLQLEELVQHIKDAADAFTVRTLGRDAVDPAVVERLRKLHLLPEKATAYLIQYGFVLGRLHAFLSEPGYAALTFEELLAHADVHRPLTWLERTMLTSIEESVANGIRSIARKATGAVLDAIDRERVTATHGAIYKPEDVVREVVREGVADRKSVNSVISDLRERLSGYESDWSRIAASEMWTAVQMGHAVAIREERGAYAGTGGAEATVYVRPLPSACRDCKRINLDKNGVPRNRKLAELLANGTNRGKSRLDWQPVVPPLHPNCACALLLLPPGYSLDAKGQSVLTDRLALITAMRRKRSVA